MRRAFLAILAVATLLAVAASLALGSYRGVGPCTLAKLLSGSPLSPVERWVLARRLLRTVAAALLGIGLGVSGAGLQYVLRNPLADPYLLGLASGAALGALGAIALGLYDPYAVYSFAFLAALLTFAMVLVVSILAGMSPLAMVVAGVTISYTVSAINTVLVMMLEERVRGSFLWLFGSVAYALEDEVIRTAPIVVAAVLWLFARARAINTLILGEEAAESTGVDVRRLRAEVVVAGALATAGVVAYAGPVGFLGLAAPWLARLAVGSDFRRLVIVTGATGPLLAIVADTVARIALAPQEIPLTAVTSVIGTPVLVYLLIKRRMWRG